MRYTRSLGRRSRMERITTYGRTRRMWRRSSFTIPCSSSRVTMSAVRAWIWKTVNSLASRITFCGKTAASQSRVREARRPLHGIHRQEIRHDSSPGHPPMPDWWQDSCHGGSGSEEALRGEVCSGVPQSRAPAVQVCDCLSLGHGGGMLAFPGTDLATNDQGRHRTAARLCRTW
jgi:hypothetical protein